jgi:hypothetical protein
VAAKAVIGQDAAQVGMAGERMPNMSNTSRSNQLAQGKTPVRVEHRLVLAQRRLQPQRWF